MNDTPTSSMNEKSDSLVDLVLRIYSGICAHPESLRIKPTRTFDTLTIDVTPHECDYRKLIGKEGSLFKSMLYILQSAANDIWITEGDPKRLKVRLEVVKTGDGFEAQKVPNNPGYDYPKMMTLVSDTLRLVVKGFKMMKQDTNRTTTLMIHLPSDAPIEANLAESLQKMFYAYGKATGRRLELEFNHVSN